MTPARFNVQTCPKRQPLSVISQPHPLDKQ